MASYTELAIKMVREDIIGHSEYFLSRKMELEDLAEMYYQSTMKQGHVNESKEDFGWVLYAARIIEDNESLLILYAESVFKEILKNEREFVK